MHHRDYVECHFALPPSDRPSSHAPIGRDSTAYWTFDPLEAIVRALEAHYGWSELGVRIPVRCFTHEPSIESSLKFLRKTPWAREKVESLYLFMLRDAGRTGRPHP